MGLTILAAQYTASAAKAPRCRAQKRVALSSTSRFGDSKACWEMPHHPVQKYPELWRISLRIGGNPRDYATKACRLSRAPCPPSNRSALPNDHAQSSMQHNLVLSERKTGPARARLFRNLRESSILLHPLPILPR